MPNKLFVQPDGKLINRKLFIILIFSIITKILFAFFYPDQNFPDATAYREIGIEFFSGNLTKNHTYMPLYPIWSYITGGGVMQIFMDILISTLSIWLIFLLSIYLFNDKGAALLSATVASIYPHFIFYSVSGLTEVFFTFLLLLSVLFFYKKRFFLAIIISILALLVKPTFDFLNPILIMIFVGYVHNRGWKKVIKYLFIYMVSYVVLMSPWWMHQYQKYGEFVRLNLVDGVVLYSGNNSLNKTGGGIVGQDVDMSVFDSEKNPIIKNNRMKELAIKFIIDNPDHFITLAGLKFLRFWRLWPHTQYYQQWYVITASLLSYGLTLFLAIGFIWRSGRKYFQKLLPIFAMFSYLTLVHMITIGSIRYRFPLEPFLIIFASYFLVDILKDKTWFIQFQKKLTSRS